MEIAQLWDVRNKYKKEGKDIPIMRVPSGKKPEHEEWRKDMLNIITKDRVVDAKFQEIIDKNNVFVCGLHFKEEDLLHCKYATLLCVYFEHKQESFMLIWKKFILYTVDVELVIKL